MLYKQQLYYKAQSAAVSAYLYIRREVYTTVIVLGKNINIIQYRRTMIILGNNSLSSGLNCLIVFIHKILKAKVSMEIEVILLVRKWYNCSPENKSFRCH